MPMILNKKMKKIILVPYPAQGHVTPMLKLASLLSTLNFRPVIVSPEFIHRRIHPHADAAGIDCLSIPAGRLDEDDSPHDFFAVEMAMEESMPSVLEDLLRKMMIDDGEEICCLVADLLASWAIDVGRRCGLAVAGFWPAMHATYRIINAIPRLIRDGVISEDGCPRNPNAPICLSPNEPTLTANDLPWLIGSSLARISRFRFWTRTLQRSNTLRCLLINTFPNEVESEMQQSTMFNIHKTPQVFEIGPLIMQAVTISNGSFWEEDTSCLDWLDNQNVGAVVYVSFGSWVSPIGEAKVKNLALTLEALKKPFIWVLGPTWRRGLPDGFVERVAAHGRIVPWAPQMEVLHHPAVGYYLTHCGWNSTMEAIQCKKPIMCYPIAGDQFLNCAYIVRTWKIGVKLEGFGIEEVDNGIKKIVENDQMNQRIETLNERLFGKEGSYKAMSNLLTFIRDVGK